MPTPNQVLKQQLKEEKATNKKLLAALLEVRKTQENCSRVVLELRDEINNHLGDITHLQIKNRDLRDLLHKSHKVIIQISQV